MQFPSLAEECTLKFILPSLKAINVTNLEPTNSIQGLFAMTLYLVEEIKQFSEYYRDRL